MKIKIKSITDPQRKPWYKDLEGIILNTEGITQNTDSTLQYTSSHHNYYIITKDEFNKLLTNRSPGLNSYLDYYNLWDTYYIPIGDAEVISIEEELKLCNEITFI